MIARALAVLFLLLDMASCADSGTAAAARYNAGYDVEFGLVMIEQHNDELAVMHFNQALASGLLTPEQQVEVHISRAAAQIRRQHYDDAIADCDDALKLKPDVADALLNRAIARHHKADTTAARSDLDSAIKLYPSFAEAYSERAALRRDQGDLDGAIADYSSALEIKPYLIEVYVARGTAYAAEHQPARAIADFDAAIRRQPDCAPALKARAEAQTQLAWPVK